MDSGILAIIITSATLVGGAIGWLARQYWHYRATKREAAHDANEILSKRKGLLEDMISKTQDAKHKIELNTQLEEVHAALLGLYGERLSHTLKEAGLPTEEILIADGRRKLQPEQAKNFRDFLEKVRPLSEHITSRSLLLRLGNAYYDTDQYQKAKDMYDKILQVSPNDPIVLNNRGATYACLGKYDEALDDYNLSLNLNPEHPVIVNGRGFTYAKLKRYEEAIADYNRSLELRPDDPDTQYNLACLFSLWGKPDKALAYLEKAIDRDKKYREMAKTDKDFDNIRDAPRFKKLIESD